MTNPQANGQVERRKAPFCQGITETHVNSLAHPSINRKPTMNTQLNLLFKRLTASARFFPFLLLNRLDPKQAPASVELDKFGAQVEVTESSNDSSFSVIRGGVGSLSASFNSFTPSVDAGDPRVFIEASLADSDDRLALPVLRAAASSGGDKDFISGTGIASQGYTFTGETEQTFFIDIELTGTAEGDAFGQAIFAFAAVGDSFDVFRYIKDVGDRFYFLDNSAPVLLGINENSPDLQAGVAQITVQPGDSFYVVAILKVAARQGGSIDTSDLFTAAFRPTPALADLLTNARANGQADQRKARFC